MIAVYVEATGEETEARLLKGLRKHCPDLPADLGLNETLAALRRGQGLPAGKKVLIVLDQFEQWLHAKKEEQNTELVQALRQCDGGGCSASSWCGTTSGWPSAGSCATWRFDWSRARTAPWSICSTCDHARKVLAAFGRAFGKLAREARRDDQGADRSS